jgi:hypothetical protein
LRSSFASLTVALFPPETVKGEVNKNELLVPETSIVPLKSRKSRKKIKIFCFYSDKSTRNSFAKTRNKKRSSAPYRVDLAVTRYFYIRCWLQFGRLASRKQATPSAKKELVPKIDTSPSLCTLPSMLYRW